MPEMPRHFKDCCSEWCSLGYPLWLHGTWLIFMTMSAWFCSVRFSSRWYLCTWENPWVMHTAPSLKSFPNLEFSLKRFHCLDQWWSFLIQQWLFLSFGSLWFRYIFYIICIHNISDRHHLHVNLKKFSCIHWACRLILSWTELLFVPPVNVTPHCSWLNLKVVFSSRISLVAQGFLDASLWICVYSVWLGVGG